MPSKFPPPLRFTNAKHFEFKTHYTKTNFSRLEFQIPTPDLSNRIGYYSLTSGVVVVMFVVSEIIIGVVFRVVVELTPVVKFVYVE